MKGNNSDSKNSFMKNIFYALVAVALLFFLLYITYRLSHQVYKQNQINQEISKLQTEIARLSQENKQLDELTSYLQTDEFKEKEAKDKLNLIKEGEQLVLVKEKESRLDEVLSEKEAKQAEVIVNHENYWWWYYYFFDLR